MSRHDLPAHGNPPLRRRPGACACVTRTGQRCRDANLLLQDEHTTRALYDLTDSWGARLEWVRARRAVKFHAGRAA